MAPFPTALLLTPWCFLLSTQSSVCAKIVQLLGQNEVDYRQKQVVILSQDSFYRVLTSEQKAKALKGQFNFDHPGECVCVFVDRHGRGRLGEGGNLLVLFMRKSLCFSGAISMYIIRHHN